MAAGAPESIAQASGLTGQTIGDDDRQRRFWINFDSGARSWTGGHTAPSSGVLPVTAGRYQMSASGVVLQDGSGRTIGRVNGFTSLTSEGETGTGAIENPPAQFSWKAIR